MAFAQSAENFWNLDYAGQRRPDQTLDLDVPSGPGPFPLLIHIHGGDWRSGEKGVGTGVDEIRPRMRELGYAFATINYRLSTTEKWPAQIMDCQAAVRFLRSNAQRFRLDAKRFALWGTAAGGHLAAMMGVAPFWGGPLSGAEVQAVIDWYGPSFLMGMNSGVPPACPNPINYNAPDSPVRLLVDCSSGSRCPLNLEIPSDLSGPADISVTISVGGVPSNPVRVRIE